MQFAKNPSSTLDAAVRTVPEGTATTLEGDQSTLMLSEPSSYSNRSAQAQQSAAAIRYEAENLTLSGYKSKSQSQASAGTLITLAKDVRSGTASGNFTGKAGTYSVKVGYVDERNGVSQATVTVAGQSSSFKFDRTSGSKRVEKTLFANLSLRPGDRFQITGKADGKEKTQIDWLDFAPLSISPPVSTIPIGSTPAITDDFSGDWMKRWGIESKGLWGQQNMQVVNEGSKFNSVLRINYPAGSASPTASRNEKVPLGGAQFYADFDKPPQTAAHLSYDLRFSDNFAFVKGGKLPGLYGGTGNSGGNTPDGTDGFSTRFMWRTQGQGEAYAYLPTSDEYGTSLGRGAWQFKPGVWHHIEQEVVLNQPGKNDGQLQVWFDGKSVFKEDKLTFRSVDTLKIDGIFFSTFFGGNDTSWSTPKNVSVDFANFALSSVK